jgi:hypothetical protein
VLAGILILASTGLIAQSWDFSTPVNVSAAAKEGVFHHLESSGRRNIAVSGDVVGVVWEDDSDGTPRVYLALKSRNSSEFSPKLRISAVGEAYEPSITALGDGRFAIAWEEDEQVSARIVASQEMGPIAKVGDKTSSQVSLASEDDRVLLVHREQTQRFGQIVLQELMIENQFHLSPVKRCLVDSGPLKDDQLYPVIALLDERVNVVWEDRRLGHTIILHSRSEPGEACAFSSPARVSEEPPGPKSEFGAGHGVARAVLTGYGASGLFAAWADKRDFQEGYDIYGASKQSDQAFGANVRVQDDFGANYRQWHPTASGHEDGQLVVTWTDERDGSMDVWYSELEDGEWSDDAAVPGASGKGIQYHPSITLDHSGNLHLAWIHREDSGGPTQILYLFAAPEMGER